MSNYNELRAAAKHNNSRTLIAHRMREAFGLPLHEQTQRKRHKQRRKHSDGEHKRRYYERLMTDRIGAGDRIGLS